MALIAKAPTGITTRTLGLFLALTFGVSWGAIALVILFYDQMVAIFGEISTTNPLFILAVYGPGLVGVLLVWWHYGLKGLGSFLRRLTLWRAPTLWWLFLIAGIPAIVYASAAVKGTASDPFPFSPWHQALPALALALFLGPIEEFGWRGLALPLLQRRFAPVWAGLILGVIWATWHIPAFLLSGTPQSAWSIGPFFAGVVAISVILTPLFNAARGSLLIAVLYHFQMMNPIWPDAQPWDNLLFVIAAVIIVWLNRRTMFRHGAGVTDVLMPENRDALLEPRHGLAARH
jgi:membrane protease YdiL (CAAX protease family)